MIVIVLMSIYTVTILNTSVIAIRPQGKLNLPLHNLGCTDYYLMDNYPAMNIAKYIVWL